MTSRQQQATELPNPFLNPATLFQPTYEARGNEERNKSRPISVQVRGLARTAVPGDLSETQMNDAARSFTSAVRVLTFPFTAPFEFVNALFAPPEAKMPMGETRSGFLGGL